MGDPEAYDKGFEAGYQSFDWNDGGQTHEDDLRKRAELECPYNELDEMRDFDTWVDAYINGYDEAYGEQDADS